MGHYPDICPEFTKFSGSLAPGIQNWLRKHCEAKFFTQTESFEAKPCIAKALIWILQNLHKFETSKCVVCSKPIGESSVITKCGKMVREGCLKKKKGLQIDEFSIVEEKQETDAERRKKADQRAMKEA